MRRALLDRFAQSTMAIAALTVTLSAATTASAEPATQTPGEPSFASSGFYVGGHFGYAAGKSSTTLLDSSAQTATGTYGMLAGGLHAGYARMLGSRLVLGLEAGASVPNFLENDDRISSLSTPLGQVDEKIDCVGAVRARVGYAFARGLVYGAGGLAWSLGHFTFDSGADQGREEKWRFRPGWTLGAGFELPVGSAWTARLEYAYDQLEQARTAFAAGPSATSTVGMHSVQLGLSWRIPWPATRVPPKEPVDLPSGSDSTVPSLDIDRNAPDDRRDTAGAQPRWNIHGQTTFVGQGDPGFHSPYQGAQSLAGSSQFENTVSATAFLGLRPWLGGEIYFNPEIMQGFGLSNTHGVAGFPNGEAQKSNFPIPRFNAARIFMSQTFALGNEREIVDDAPNQLAGERSVARITVTAGKFAVTDFFLLNAFAGEPRTTFLNWNIYGGGSYDWTMDLLSWTWGTLAELNQKRWALRAGYFLLPAVSNTNHFDLHAPSNGQYTAEGDLHYSVFGRRGKVQLFGWLSHGNIGSYSAALAQPTTTPNYPDIALTRGHNRFNYGTVLSVEQAISDTFGVFSRASWSPEEGESMGWTDCGQSFSLGAALKGAWWRRSNDTLGLAGLIEGLSPIARRYFTAGGMGTIIGDGQLNYAPETIVEAYYAFSPFNWSTATLDYQLVVNPGYNADRGPVSIFAIRLHASF